MSNIEKRGENSYRFTVTLPRDAQGKYPKVRKTITVEGKYTPKQLREYLDGEYLNFKNEVLSGSYVKPQKMLFKDFANRWLQDFASTLAKTTYGNHQRKLNLHIMPVIGHMPLEQITTLHLMRIITEMKRHDDKGGELSFHSKQDVYRTIKSIFKYAHKWGLTDKDISAGLEKPRPLDTDDMDNELQVYDENETAQLMKLIQEEPIMWRILFTLALATGMRKGELLGLQWQDIDFVNNEVNVRRSIVLTKEGPHIKTTKTRKGKRSISLPQSVMEELKFYRKEWVKNKLARGDVWIEKDYEWLFHKWNGPHLYPTSPTKRWAKFIESTKGEVRFIRLHDLRHTQASLLIAQGVHAKIISERLGHSDISITMNLYGHALKSADRTAADKLDDFFKVKKKS